MVISSHRQAMLQILERESPKFSFLTSFFQSPETNVKKSPYISIDIKGNKRNYAVDIVPGTGSRLKKRTKYTNKMFAPPAYKMATILDAEELNFRPAGLVPTDAEKQSYAQQATAIMASDMVEIAGDITRAIEKQARDAFFNGSVTLVDGTVINFGKSGTHNTGVSTKWDNASGDPMADIAYQCDLIRKDANLSATSFDLILDEVSYNAFINNAKVKALGGFQKNNMNLISLSMPQGVNAEGATLHGVVACGVNTVYVWVYTGFYDIPTGYGLASEGTTVSYMPAKSGLLIARGARFDLVFAGIPRLVKFDGSGLLPMVPNVIASRMEPFVVVDQEGESVKYGLESRPLTIPTEINAFSTFTGIIS